MDLITHNEITPAVNQIGTQAFFQRQAEQEFMRAAYPQLPESRAGPQ
jgi:hypothetical protein